MNQFFLQFDSIGVKTIITMGYSIILNSAVETRNIAAPTDAPDYAKIKLITSKVTTFIFTTPITPLDTTLFTISTAEFRFNKS